MTCVFIINKNETKDCNGLNSIEESIPVPTETETVEATNRLSAPGHGRLPHSAYTNTIEHQVSIPGRASTKLIFLAILRLSFIWLVLILRA